MLVICVLYIVTVLSILAARSISYARQVQPSPADDVYVVVLHLRGGLWTLLGPPACLAAVWLAVRRSRPAS